MRLFSPPLSRLWLGKEVVAIKKEFGLLFRRWIEEEEAVVAALSIRSGGRERGKGDKVWRLRRITTASPRCLGSSPFLLPLLLWMKMERSERKGGEGDSTMIETGNKGCCFLFISKLKLLIFIDCANEGQRFLLCKKFEKSLTHPRENRKEGENFAA